MRENRTYGLMRGQGRCFYPSRSTLLFNLFYPVEKIEVLVNIFLFLEDIQVFAADNEITVIHILKRRKYTFICGNLVEISHC